MSGDKQYHPEDPLGDLYWRDEILQVMYWMTGEGFGTDFGVADLQKFLQAEHALLANVLERMVSAALLERVDGAKYALSALGQREGRRRFADEFEEMLKPGHFECDDPDCDCHNPDSLEACKHLSPAHAEHQHS